MPALKLSVLDQSVARVGHPQDESIRHTLALAEHCEALGYERFWVSEHHSIPAIVGSAPEVLMAAIAARTRRIRIGSAGVMLPHYTAFKVAEQFRVLDALAPGRIDLGVGRAPGGDMRTARLLNPQASSGDDFPQQVVELQAWIRGEPMPPGPLLPPQEAQRAYTPAEEAQARDLRRRSLVGSAQQVGERLQALADDWQLDELVVLTWAWDPAVQRRSYELLARAFSLA